jgi:putative flippase GtrA
MKLHQQLFRFGVVGMAAMAVHLAVVSATVPFGLNPLIANVLAFFVAFQISYHGHRRWTFHSKNERSASYLRLLLVSLASFTLNETLYSAVLQTGLDYRLGLLGVLIVVSGITFVLSRFWVFREIQPTA